MLLSLFPTEFGIFPPAPRQLSGAEVPSVSLCQQVLAQCHHGSVCEGPGSRQEQAPATNTRKAGSSPAHSHQDRSTAWTDSARALA